MARPGQPCACRQREKVVVAKLARMRTRCPRLIPAMHAAPAWEVEPAAVAQGQRYPMANQQQLTARCSPAGGINSCVLTSRIWPAAERQNPTAEQQRLTARCRRLQPRERRQHLHQQQSSRRLHGKSHTTHRPLQASTT